MDNGSKTKPVQQVYENFGTLGRDRARGADMEALVGLYSDDVEWDVPQMENVRIGGKRRGLDSVREFFSSVMEDFDVLDFEPQEFITEGDTVVALGRYSWRVKATGRDFSSPFAHVYTVRDGKIVRFREYMDTAAEVKAHKKRDGGPRR